MNSIALCINFWIPLKIMRHKKDYISHLFRLINKKISYSIRPFGKFMVTEILMFMVMSFCVFHQKCWVTMVTPKRIKYITWVWSYYIWWLLEMLLTIYVRNWRLVKLVQKESFNVWLITWLQNNPIYLINILFLIQFYKIC